jgi:hypothetical protein
MPSLMAFPSCEARIGVLRECGFTNANSIDMNRSY